MNFNKDLWDDTEAREMGEYERLELGGHELVIKDAREHTNPQTGNVSLKVSVDIAGNDKQKDFFKKQYEADTRKDKKWPNGGIKYLSLRDESLSYLKGFTKSLEKSNSNFKFNKDGNWDQIKGLKVAGQFGLEEYTKQNGSVGTATKLIQFRSLEKLDEITIPKVKLLNGDLVDYESYRPASSTTQVNNSADPFGDFGDTVEITDDFLD